MCFSMAYLQSLFVWVVVVVAIFALLKLLLSAIIPGVQFWPLAPWPPTAGQPAGFIGFILAALSIVFWAFVAIVMIYFIFMLIGCLLSFTGGFPFPHR